MTLGPKYFVKKYSSVSPPRENIIPGLLPKSVPVWIIYCTWPVIHHRLLQGLLSHEH